MDSLDVGIDMALGLCVILYIAALIALVEALGGIVIGSIVLTATLLCAWIIGMVVRKIA